MGLLEKIRNKPHEKKIRLIWIFAGVAVIIMVILWLLVGQMKLDPNQSLIGNIKDRIGNPGKTFPKLFNTPNNTNASNTNASNIE